MRHWVAWPIYFLFALAALGSPRAFSEEPREGVESCPAVQDDRLQRTLLASLETLATAEKTRTVPELLAEKAPRSAALRLPLPHRVERDGPTLHRYLSESALIVGARYKCGKCSKWHLSLASGFPIAQGAVVTNHHVLAGAKDRDAMAVMDGRGKVYPVRGLLAADPDHDLVILDVEGMDLPPLPLAPEPPVPPGTEIAVMSNPRNFFFLYTTGVVSRLAEFRSHASGRPAYEVLCITADFAPGSSGAAVVDRKGNVVGVAQRIVPIQQQPSAPPDRTSPAASPAGAYTAMMVRLAVPVERLRALVKPVGK